MAKTGFLGGQENSWSRAGLLLMRQLGPRLSIIKAEAVLFTTLMTLPRRVNNAAAIKRMAIHFLASFPAALSEGRMPGMRF